jgi:amidase
MATPGPGGSDWKAKCAGKRAEAQNKIPKEWTIKTEWVSSRLMAPYEENTNNMIGAQIAEACEFLSQRELSITGEYTVKQLLEALATGTLTAYEVAVAFCKRAAMAQQLVCRPPTNPSRCHPPGKDQKCNQS